MRFRIFPRNLACKKEPNLYIINAATRCLPFLPTNLRLKPKPRDYSPTRFVLPPKTNFVQASLQQTYTDVAMSKQYLTAHTINNGTRLQHVRYSYPRPSFAQLTKLLEQPTKPQYMLLA
ncbi:hypothetical protein ABW21_db0206609 [Orbilia brochopaga]|nr:hypothetical protein ABW21_db0206609 [Drechslerella brochopaga]